jgi:hypothetical protein
MLFVLKTTYLIMGPCANIRRVVRTRQTCQHSPRSVARTRQTCQHSPSRVARTRQNRQYLPNHLPSTRQTRRHSPKAIFEKNVTCLATFAQVIRHSCKFGASGHCLKLIHLHFTIFINSTR